MQRNKNPMPSLERSLYKLNAIRELGEWAKEFVDPNAEIEDDGSDGNMGRPIQMVEDEDKVWEMGMKELESGEQFDPDAPVFHEVNGAKAPTQPAEIIDAKANIYNQPCVTSMPSAAVLHNNGPVPIRRDSVIVIIRHGKTEHNKLGLFTGWVRNQSCFRYSCIIVIECLVLRRIQYLVSYFTGRCTACS